MKRKYQDIEKFKLFKSYSRTIYKSSLKKITHITKRRHVMECSPIEIGLTLASIPFTATIGACVKTSIDVWKRKPLLLDVISNTIENMNNLSDDDLNKVVETVLSFHSDKNPHFANGSRKKLQSNLFKGSVPFQIEQSRLHKEKEYIELSKGNISIELNRLMKEYGLITDSEISLFRTHNVYKVNEDIKTKIDHYIDKIKPDIIQISRKQKIIFLKVYLNDSANSGKKLQHVIVDMVASLVKTKSEEKTGLKSIKKR